MTLQKGPLCLQLSELAAEELCGALFSRRLVHGGTGKIVSLPTTEDASKLAAAVSNSRAPNQGAIRWSFESLSRSSRVMLTLPERRAESDL